MSFEIEKLKLIPIIDIANRLGIKIYKNKAMCFKGHDHKTPSLSFSPNKNLWHCFGCDIGGNNITLIQEYYGYTFREALGWLAKNYNLSSKQYQGNYVTLPRWRFDAVKPNDNPKQYSHVDHEIYEAFLSRCNLSTKGKEYLENRGYKTKTINYFNIKDVIEIGETEKWLLKSFNKNRLLESGLMVVRKGNIRLIWWDYTVLFPFIETNKIIYIQGRRLENTGPKYLGLSGIEKPLYNRNILRKLSLNSTVLICEGITDTLTANQMGFNAVGVLGAASFRDDFVSDLTRFRIVVVPDNDSAGRMFEQKVKNAFQKKGHIIEAIRIESGKDLTELLKGARNASS